MFLRILSMCFLFTLGTALTAQCNPVAPTGNFAVASTLLAHTYTDGYQVDMIVRKPNVADPACGWPLVVVVHGGGGDKSVVAGIANSIASRGYCTVAYDVRGQGPSMAANNPAIYGKTVDDVRELIDLFEIMEAVEAAFPAAVDFDRIGVTGFSQGAHHSWWAATNSGRLPPPNPWRAAAFPLVKCVVLREGGGPGFGGISDLGVSSKMVQKAFGPPAGTWQEPAGLALVQAAILAEDFATLRALQEVPALDPAVLLPASQVPVFAHASYDDYRVDPSRVLDSWNQLPAILPKRFVGGAEGHSAPSNQRDHQFYERGRQDWLDHFLKDVPNGIAQGAPIDLSVTPDAVAAYQNPLSLWDHRRIGSVPSASTVTQSFYLTGGGNLIPVVPGAQGAVALNHTPPAGASMANYVAAAPSVAMVVASFGLNALQWTTPALLQDRHLQGEATLQLHVASMDTRYQIHAVLFDVDPAGNERYVADAGALVRDNLPAGANTLDLRFYLQSYVFRAGHQIRVQLENLMIHRPPTGNGTELRVVPYFNASSVNIRFGPMTPSRLDLPFEPFTAPTLVTGPLAISVGSPENQRFAIHTSSSHAGDNYLLLLGASGTTPGIGLGGGAVLPLNLDALVLSVSLNPNSPPLVDFAGMLSSVGLATPGVTLGGMAIPAGLVGTEIFAAGLVLAPGGALVPTNAVRLPFIP